MHSVRLEATKFILIGTRTTYQATGDAGYGMHHKNTGEVLGVLVNINITWYRLHLYSQKY